MNDKNKTEARREFLKKGAYAAPVIMTLAAKPSFASQGSKRGDDDSSSSSSSS